MSRPDTSAEEYLKVMDKLIEILGSESSVDVWSEMKDGQKIRLQEFVTAHTNAEIAKVLDRLESNKETLYWWTGGEYEKTTAVDMRAIAAEREQLTKLEAEL